MNLPLPGFHANGNFAIGKNLQLGDFHPYTQYARQLHQSAGDFADQAFEQIHVIGRAFINDNLAHLAIVEHVTNIIIARLQGLATQMQLNIDLNWLRFLPLVRQHPEAGSKTQPRQTQNLLAMIFCWHVQ